MCDAERGGKVLSLDTFGQYVTMGDFKGNFTSIPTFETAKNLQIIILLLNSIIPLTLINVSFTVPSHEK